MNLKAITSIFIPKNIIQNSIMPKLCGLSLSAHLDSLFLLPKYNSIYGYPIHKIYHGFPEYDFSVNIFGKTAGTPLGPAAGPHTQLAQNILLSYLAGSRIIELKTIQILDQLKISRPCIDMRNIGFNIEWSQELYLDQSFKEYLHAWILLHLIKEQKLLGNKNIPSFYDFIFDISVGYDLEGIQSEKVQSWLNKIKNAKKYISEAVDNLSNKYNSLKKIKFPPVISDSVTLSTFHGCPPSEVEKIVNYLMKENGFNVVIKLNPTLLGYEFVYKLLINKLGYKQLQLDKAAFDNDINLENAIAMISRLKKSADICNRKIGVKFTNTLVVKNNETIFSEPVRYLSGKPLYMIAMHTMQQFRDKAGWDLPVSFSGGVDKSNFVNTLTCNMIPVTACTDILKRGGYTRFNNYLNNLKIEMDKIQSNSLKQFIILRAGISQKEPVWRAGQINATNLIKQIYTDPRYSWNENKTIPKTIQSKLKFFDCINCNICIPVCPNAANFVFSLEKSIEPFSDYIYINGSFSPINDRTYKIEKNQQIGNIAEFCNDCGNCETFCPEIGAPFKVKPRFYINYENFNSQEAWYGFHFISRNSILSKVNGVVTKLEYNSDKKIYIYSNGQVTIYLNESNKIIRWENNIQIEEEFILDLETFIISKFILVNYIKYRHQFPSYLS